MEQHIAALIRGFENGDFFVERSHNDFSACCYICGCTLEETSWRLLHRTHVGRYEAIEQFDLDESCYHALLAVSGYAETPASLPIDRDQAMASQQHPITAAFTQAHWRYSKQYHDAQKER